MACGVEKENIPPEFSIPIRVAEPHSEDHEGHLRCDGAGMSCDLTPDSRMPSRTPELGPSQAATIVESNLVPVGCVSAHSKEGEQYVAQDTAISGTVPFSEVQPRGLTITSGVWSQTPITLCEPQETPQNHYEQQSKHCTSSRIAKASKTGLSRVSKADLVRYGLREGLFTPPQPQTRKTEANQAHHRATTKPHNVVASLDIATSPSATTFTSRDNKLAPSASHSSLSDSHCIPPSLRTQLDALLKKYVSDGLFQLSVNTYLKELFGKSKSPLL